MFVPGSPSWPAVGRKGLIDEAMRQRVIIVTMSLMALLTMLEVGKPHN